MKLKYLIPMLGLLLLIIIVMCCIPKKKEEFIEHKGICAFDLDQTITCGIGQAAKAIKMCKDLDYKIAIITARPTPWYSDIKLDKLGLRENDFIDDFYHGESFNCSFTNEQCFEKNISSTKVKHLKTLEDKYKIDPKYIILFDDQIYNVKAAIDAGYKAIHANHDQCGLPLNTYERISEINDS